MSDGVLTSDAVQVSFAVLLVNHAPLASTGADQTAVSGTLVTLDSGGSRDPDGDAITYAWTQIAGPQLNLVNPNTVAPVFTAPAVTTPTTFGFQVVVTDSHGSSASNKLYVTVTPSKVDSGCASTGGATLLPVLGLLALLALRRRKLA